MRVVSPAAWMSTSMRVMELPSLGVPSSSTMASSTTSLVGASTSTTFQVPSNLSPPSGPDMK
jgi:hypothetical protein